MTDGFGFVVKSYGSAIADRHIEVREDILLVLLLI